MSKYSEMTLGEFKEGDKPNTLRYEVNSNQLHKQAMDMIQKINECNEEALIQLVSKWSPRTLRRLRDMIDKYLEEE